MPIFDQGYQHWKGTLAGHAWRWAAITRHGVRTQLRNRFVRLALILAWLPAIGLIGALSVWGLLEQQAESVLAVLNRMLPPEMVSRPSDYRVAVWTILYSFFFKFELFTCMLLVLIVGPNLISRDLRFNAFPLYFSRPLRRFDYFVGKLGVIGVFLSATAILPAVAAYVFGVLFSLDLRVVKDTMHLLWGTVLYGLIIVVSAGMLMLALSSLSRRSVYVGLAWLGVWLISDGVGNVLTIIHRETLMDAYHREERAKIDVPPPKGGWQPNSDEWKRYDNARTRAHFTAVRRAEADWSEVAPHDWRPLCSYTANLNRMADLLLNADAAWVTVGRIAEQPRRMAGPIMNPRDLERMAILAEQKPSERRIADQIVYQFPWYWSAGVLAGLLLLSLWILTTRVKTLDRLR